MANVSKMTVSRVINQLPSVNTETRARVLEIIDKVGYTPDPSARRLASRRPFLIGLIYDNPNAPYVVKIQEGALEAVRRRGFELLVHPCKRDSETFLPEIQTKIRQQRLDGVILLPPVSESPELTALLKNEQCPYVKVISAELDAPENMVVYMDRRAVQDIAKHLVQLGHTRIAMISGPSTYRSSIERLTGFKQALEELGLPLQDRYHAKGSYNFESGVECGTALLSQPEPPTAIFAGNDETAGGVYRAAYLKNVRIPDELTVIGYDDSPLAQILCPSLTTMHQPIFDIGRLSAERVIAKIDGDTHGPAGAISFVPNLIVRGSSAPPPAKK
jgi:LacI family transcriptional regulator